MCAYRKWGIDFAGKLIGDFALARWEPRLNMLVLAPRFCGAEDPLLARRLE